MRAFLVIFAAMSRHFHEGSSHFPPLMLECVAQTPLVLTDAYDLHDSVSLMNNEMSHGSDGNLDARVRDKNLVSTNDKFLVMI